jgi:hypothetical protein
MTFAKTHSYKTITYYISNHVMSTAAMLLLFSILAFWHKFLIRAVIF